MEKSVIKWRTGTPTELNDYIVTTKQGVTVDAFLTSVNQWCNLNTDDVIAWCPVSEIEPYKE